MARSLGACLIHPPGVFLFDKFRGNVQAYKAQIFQEARNLGIIS